MPPRRITPFDFTLLIIGLIMLVLASVNTVLVIFSGAALGILYPRIRALRRLGDTQDDQAKEKEAQK